MNATQLTTILCIICGLWISAESFNIWVPETCCAPDVWEADVINMATSYGSFAQYNMPESRFAYDYPNRRWALTFKVENNTFPEIRIIKDYQQKKKWAITENGCFAMKNKGKMMQHCVPLNATFQGRFQYGVTDRLLADAWSYDMIAFPTRRAMVFTKDCYPLQDSTFGLVRNTWAWEEGEPMCNPYEERDKVESGECFQSFQPRIIQRSVIEVTAGSENFVYRNLELELRHPEIFDVPEDCTEVKAWLEDEVQIPKSVRMFMLLKKP